MSRSICGVCMCPYGDEGDCACETQENGMNNYERATQEVRDAFNALCQGRVEAAVKAEREACAKVAGRLWQQYKDTKDAHERNSEKPFAPSRFGFDQATVQQSQRMMGAIRARGNT